MPCNCSKNKAQIQEARRAQALRRQERRAKLEQAKLMIQKAKINGQV